MKKQILKYVLLAIILVPQFMLADLFGQWISNETLNYAGAALIGVLMSVCFTLLQVYWDRKKK